MKVPLSLIKTYLPIDASIDTLCDTLTLLGIEVDAVINEHPTFAKVIVGEVKSVKPHPDAKKLQIAQVHNGKEEVQVVCGAPNCLVGIKTAFAVPGSMIQNQPIKAATLRGVESFGMLCSASELGLWKELDGIMELPLDWENGKDLSAYLWDPVFEVSLTPNLGHCFSALGLARELAASLQKKVSLKPFEESSGVEEKIKVEIEDYSLNPRYMGCLIENVKIGPSPFWLQKALLLSGMKPINNVVDATNYILLKTGQPLHAFDFDLIEGKTLKIGPAKTKEKWLGLDGIWREIEKNTLVISDENKIVAAAGVLGGENSAVNENTQNIFLEAAFFDPVTIRKGAKTLGVRTDSAIRFEKGVDPNGIPRALDDACKLIAEVSGGKVSSKKIDLKKKEFARKKIVFRPEKANALLGTKLSQSEMEDIFKRLECTLSKGPDQSIIVEPPTYRFDLNIEVDLIEEVVRLYGYNNVQRGLAKSISSQIPNDPVYLFEKTLRKRLTALGLQEFLSADLISPKLAEICVELLSSKGIRPLKATHAKTEEYSILRPSLLPGILQIAKTNLWLKNQTFSGFEIGRIHFLQDGKNTEIPMLALVIVGKEAPHHFDQKPSDVNFYTLKGLIENLLDALGIQDTKIQGGDHWSFHPGRQAEIRHKDLVLGSFGELHPEVLTNFDIKQRVLFAEIDLEHLMRYAVDKPTFKQIPNLPSSMRDWTIPLDPSFQMEELFQSIQTHQPHFLESFELIDLYCVNGEKQNQATLRFTYRDPIKTISAEEVEKEHGKLISQVLSEISC